MAAAAQWISLWKKYESWYKRAWHGRYVSKYVDYFARHVTLGEMGSSLAHYEAAVAAAASEVEVAVIFVRTPAHAAHRTATAPPDCPAHPTLHKLPHSTLKPFSLDRLISPPFMSTPCSLCRRAMPARRPWPCRRCLLRCDFYLLLSSVLNRHMSLIFNPSYPRVRPVPIPLSRHTIIHLCL